MVNKLNEIKAQFDDLVAQAKQVLDGASALTSVADAEALLAKLAKVQIASEVETRL